MTEEELGIENPDTWAKIKPRQQLVFDYIKQHIEDHGYPPTMRDVADATGVSLSTARSDLDRLAAAGLIRVDWGKPRAIKVLRRGSDDRIPE